MEHNEHVEVKFRDLIVAEDVGRKAELGWFDVEFTMYGCAYLDIARDKMCYRVSENEEDIYTFIEQSVHKGIYASNVRRMTEKYPVPSGMKNLIAQDVKRELALQLRKEFPRAFFETLYQAAETFTTDQAAVILWKEAEQLEGVFDEDRLSDFLALVKYCDGCRSLSWNSYQALLAWYHEEMTNLDDKVVSKDIFETTMHGFAYEKDGSLRYVTNAGKGKIYSEAYSLEQKGIFVTPVIEKTYWYNYEYRLPDVIQDFKARLRACCQQNYIDKIKAIRYGKDDMTSQFMDILEHVRESWGEIPAETMMRYGYRWGILTN